MPLRRPKILKLFKKQNDFAIMHLRDRKKASTEEKDRNDCVLASNCPS